MAIQSVDEDADSVPITTLLEAAAATAVAEETTAVEEDESDRDPLTILLEQEEEEEDERGNQAPRETADDLVVENPQKHYLQAIDSVLLIRQLPSQGLSFQLWPAATTLVSLLDHHHQSNDTPLSTFLNHQRRQLHILELGSGTGFLGIAAAAILGASVTLTDLPHVLPNLQFNADLNSSAIGSHGGSVHVASLRWGEAEDVKLLGRDQFDIIFGSDVVYHDHLFDPLLQTLCCFFRGDTSVTFLMAHLRRWKKDSVFFNKARKLFQVQKIHSDPPLPGSRIGVVVYSFASKR